MMGVAAGGVKTGRGEWCNCSALTPTPLRPSPSSPLRVKVGKQRQTIDTLGFDCRPTLAAGRRAARLNPGLTFRRRPDGGN